MEKFYRTLSNMPAVDGANNKKSKGNVSPNTIFEIHKILRICFRQAVKWGIMEKNPAIDATLPKRNKKKREIWTAEMLMQAIETNSCCQRFLDASEGLVKFVGLAPEESEDAVAFVEAMKDKVNISLAHTNADYAHAKAAFDAGANHAVHLFNAMPAFTHREPGVVGAVSDSAHVMAEIICDGVHIHPSMVRAAFKMMGADRMILISDSMRATGMPDGQYTLGGLDVKVVGNHATLVSDGALAGSVTNLADCMRTVVKKMEIPLETAVACATINPAKSLGIEDTYGSIAPGKKANIVLLDENLELKMVIKDGQEL